MRAAPARDPRARIQSQLEALYGARALPQLGARLDELIANASRRIADRGASPGALGLSERDVLLITYGDQVTESEAAPLRTLGQFASAHLRGLVSGIHLLPHFPFTSDDGFSVTDYFAVNPALGSWADVSALGASFQLMFDGVFNHMSARSEWFQHFLAGDPAFNDFFVTVDGEPDLSQVVRPRTSPLLTAFESATGLRRVWTTFSADQVDLNFRNPAVFLAMVEVLLFYLEKGARFIRLDAIAYLWKEIGTTCIHLPQTHQVIQLLRAIVDLIAPDVLLITETNVPHRDNVSYFGDGTNEAQLVYNFALPPLVMHAVLRGDGSFLTRWAAGLEYPSEQATFFNFLASHDGIGLNPARGILPDAEINFLVERCLAHGGYVSNKRNPDGAENPYELNIVYFDALSDPAVTASEAVAIDRFIVSQAIMLVLRGMPGIYFHSLFGSRNDRAAVDRTGIKRRINRRKFDRRELENELVDPDSLRARVFGRYGQLLRARAAHPAFGPAAEQEVMELDPRVFAVRRGVAGQRAGILGLHNLADTPGADRVAARNQELALTA